MTKTKKNRIRKKCKGGGVGSSRAKKDGKNESLKNESLKKGVTFDSAENEYHSDASRDSIEMVKFTKKDKLGNSALKQQHISETILEAYEKQLLELLAELFNPDIKFIEKEV